MGFTRLVPSWFNLVVLQSVLSSLSLSLAMGSDHCQPHGHVFHVGRLETVPLTVVRSQTAVKCLETCLEIDDCVSFNFCESSIDGILNCELLDETVCNGCPLSRSVTCWKHYVIGCLKKVQENRAVETYQACYKAAFCPQHCESWSLSSRRNITHPVLQKCLYDNTGTFFLTAFMANGHRESLALSLTISSYSDVVTYNITAPRLDPGLLVSGTIDPYQTTKVNLPIELETMEGAYIENKGVLIESAGLMAVYGNSDAKFSEETFTIMPRDALRMRYYLITWQCAAFLLVGTEDDTHVTLDLRQSDALLTYNGTQYQHSILSLDLQAYATFHVSQFENTDFSGIYIKADKPIVVQAGSNLFHDNVENNRELMVDQLAPISTYGTQYVLVNAVNAGVKSIFKIIGNSPQVSVTVFTINGEMHYTLTGAGSTMTFQLNDACAYLMTDEPVGVAMLADNPDNALIDHAFMMVPPVDNWVDPPLVFATPEYDISQNVTDELMLVSPQQGLSSLRMDDASLGVAWASIPGLSCYAFASFVVPEGNHVITTVDGSWPVFAAVFRHSDREGSVHTLGQKYVKPWGGY